MNIPINHHYVSRCQSKNFFDPSRQRIFVLDKNTMRIFPKHTTKTLFSENDSNTRTNDDLSIDRASLEKDLKDNFEDPFDKHYRIVLETINSPTNPPQNYRQSLTALTKFGIIGEVRNPEIKKRTDDSVTGVLFQQILPYAAPELATELLALRGRLDKTKYSNSIIYSDFADKVLNAMGDIRCLIYAIACDKYFLLPDTSSIRLRAKINSYFNPDITEIAMVGLPLSSKVYIHSQSVKLGENKDCVAVLDDDFPGDVERINFGLFDNSFRYVACEDIEYLTKFKDNLALIKEHALETNRS